AGSREALPPGRRPHPRGPAPPHVPEAAPQRRAVVPAPGRLPRAGPRRGRAGARPGPRRRERVSRGSGRGIDGRLTRSTLAPQVRDSHRTAGDLVLSEGNVARLGAEPDADPGHRAAGLAHLVLRQDDRLGPAADVNPDAIVPTAVEDAV